MIKIPARLDIDSEDILELRNEGMTYRQIASSLNISKSTVERRMSDVPTQKKLKKCDLKEISDIEAAYLAGIVDGEGCIGLWKNEQSEKTSIRASVRIAMTSSEVIDEICQMIGTNKNVYDSSKEDWEDSHVCEVQSINEVKYLLEQIKPYLVEKRKQADLVVEFCEKRQAHKPYTDEEFKLVEELKEMRLNKGS